MENVLNNDMSLKKYYIIGLVPYIFIVIVFEIINFSFLNKIFFYLAYFWNFYLLIPNITTAINKKRYRFSFVKLIFFANEKIQTLNSKNNQYLESLLRSLSPFIFVLIFFLISNEGNMLFPLLGSLTFESIIKLQNRYQFLKKIP